MNPLEFVPRFLDPGAAAATADEQALDNGLTGALGHIYEFVKAFSMRYHARKVISYTLANNSSSNNSSTLTSPPLELSTSTPPQFLLVRLGKGLGKVLLNQISDVNSAEQQILAITNYLASKFALLCMAMAIMLNRTVIFASTRQSTALSWPSRLFLRGVALLALFHNSIPIIQAAHLMGFRFTELFRFAVDLDSVKMPGVGLLWGFYQAISLSNLVETFSSVAQGTVPYSETGMTLFEYSAAFQEVELFGKLTPEIVIISLISVFGQIALHIQGLLNSDKYRLKISCCFGVLMLGYFAVSILQGRLFYFPSICVIGYLPQLVIASIVVLCVIIQAATAIFTGTGLRNLQNNFSGVSIEATDDFYSALLKCGLVALTSSSSSSGTNKHYAAQHCMSIAMPEESWLAQIFGWQHPVHPPSRPEDTPYRNELRMPPYDAPPGRRNVPYSARFGPTNIMFINRFGQAVMCVLRFLYLCLATLYEFGRFILTLLIYVGKALVVDQIAFWVKGTITTVSFYSYDREYKKFMDIDFDDPVYEFDYEYKPSDDEDDDDYDDDDYSTDDDDENTRQEVLRRLRSSTNDPHYNTHWSDDTSGMYNITRQEETYHLVDEVLELIRDGGMAYDLLRSTLIPPDHPSRVLATQIARIDSPEEQRQQQHQHRRYPSSVSSSWPSSISPLSPVSVDLESHYSPNGEQNAGDTYSMDVPPELEQQYREYREYYTRAFEANLDPNPQPDFGPSPGPIPEPNLEPSPGPSPGPQGRRTRSTRRTRFTRRTEIDPEKLRDVMFLMNIIMSRREQAALELENRRIKLSTELSMDANRFLCVVCKLYPRDIVVWPCRCFGICNTCRGILAEHGYTGCVCCRRQVVQYSRMFVP